MNSFKLSLTRIGFICILVGSYHFSLLGQFIGVGGSNNLYYADMTTSTPVAIIERDTILYEKSDSMYERFALWLSKHGYSGPAQDSSDRAHNLEDNFIQYLSYYPDTVRRDFKYELKRGGFIYKDGRLYEEVVDSTKKTEAVTKSSLPQIHLSFESIGKRLQGGTQYVIAKNKTINGLLGLNVQVGSEESFANIFTQTDGIATSGGISLKAGIGDFAHNREFNAEKIQIVQKPYWLAYGQIGIDFSKADILIDKAIPFSVLTDQRSHFNFQGGVNRYLKSKQNGKAFGLLLGVAVAFGQTDNISQLEKQTIVTEIQDSGNAKSLVSERKVRVGPVRNFNFRSTSFDFFITHDALPTIGLLYNHNRSTFSPSNVRDDLTLKHTDRTNNLGLFFLEKDKNLFQPRMGLILAWTKRYDRMGEELSKSFNFGVTTTLRLGSFYNKSKPRTTVTTAS